MGEAQPQFRSPPPRVLNAQGVYLSRQKLSAAEQALLEMIVNLARRDGYCRAGQRYMADQLGCSDRWIRQLLRKLNVKGYIALIARPGKKTLIKVRRDEPEPPPPTRIGPPKLAQPHAQPRNDRSGVPWNYRTTPGRNDRSALTKDDINHLYEQAPLFDRRQRRFNPLRWQHAGDTRGPEVRLAAAVRSGQVLYVQHQRRQRTILDVRYSPTAVCCYLLAEAGGEQEKLIIPIRELGGWWFGR